MTASVHPRWLPSILLALAAVPLAQAGEAYRAVELDVGRGAIHLHWGKRSKDSRLALFVLHPGRVRLWEQGENGFASLPLQIELPPEPSLIDFGDVLGDAGEEVVLLTRRGVLAASPGELEPASAPGGSTDEGVFRRILPVAGIPIPLDDVHSPFIRDITADGLPDLIIPVRGGYEIYHRRGDTLEKGVLLEGEHAVMVDTGGPGLLDPLRLEVRVPHLKFRDLNGDGRLDIIARSRDRARSYIQGPGGFSPTPSHELDLARFRAEADAGSGDAGKSGRKRSPGLILGGVGVRLHETDIDGDRIQDTIIASGQHLRVYFGTKDGPDFSRPHTMLKLSSELQGVGSFDVDRDSRLDLVALKFELPGLPKLIAAYFVSMTLDFEVLGYRNEGGRRFSRRPDWKNTLSLSLPPLREVLEGFDTLADRFLEAAARNRRFGSGDVDGDSRPDAAFLDTDDVLRVYLTRKEDRPPGVVDLGSILFDAKKSAWELTELLEFIASSSHASARSAVSGRRPDIEIPAGGGYDPGDLTIEVRELNGDGKGDFVLTLGRGKLKVLLSGA